MKLISYNVKSQKINKNQQNKGNKMNIVFYKKQANSKIYYARDTDNGNVYHIQDVVGMPRNKIYEYKTCKITPMNSGDDILCNANICDNVPYVVKRSLMYYTHAIDMRRYVNFELNYTNYCC